MKRIPLSVTLLLMVAASSFATNGTRMIGFDAKSIGRGGTSIGFFDNSSLVFTNPAGISFLDGARLDADFSLVGRRRLHARRHGSGLHAQSSTVQRSKRQLCATKISFEACSDARRRERSIQTDAHSLARRKRACSVQHVGIQHAVQSFAINHERYRSVSTTCHHHRSPTRRAKRAWI